MAALIPDYDMAIGLFFPLEHGVFSHTILGGLIFTLIYASITWMLGRKFLKELDINFLLLFLLATIGMLSHLFLDSFTFYESFISDGTHHVYFWPFWDFPVHINTMFPSATYEIRILFEVLFSIFLGIVIIIRGWLIKKENPFLMFSPSMWNNNMRDLGKNDDFRTSKHLLWLFNLIILFLIGMSYVF